MQSSAGQRLPPHPKDVPLLGSLPRFARDILGAIVDGWRECGDVVRFRGPRPMALVARPEHVQRVLEERFENYPRSQEVIQALRPIMGSGLFTSGPAEAERQRRFLEPLVCGPATARFCPTIVARAEAMFERQPRLRDVPTVDVVGEMSRLTVDTMEHILFGAGGSGTRDFAAAFVDAVEYAAPRIMAPVNPPGFLPAGRRFRRSLGTLDAIVFAAMAERRRADHGDLLSELIRARDPDGRELTDGEVRDNALTLLFGAYIALPAALSWTWFRLSEEPAVRERVETEAAASFAGAKPTATEVPLLPYTTSMISEVLRLHPPVWIWSRPPIQPDEIGGYNIPAGMFVLNVPYVTHRHPEFWDEPEAFCPERFGGDGTSERHDYAYFPFAGGPRRCLGEDLAMLALPLMVAALALRYRFRIVADYAPKFGLDFMLRPSNGMPMVVEPHVVNDLR